MRKYIVTIVAASITALLLVTAPSSSANPGDNPGTTWPAISADTVPFQIRIQSNIVCVKPDFIAYRSIWKVRAAVNYWNKAMAGTVVMTLDTVPGCTFVYVHRFYSETGYDAYTDYTRGYKNWYFVSDTDNTVLYDGADIYLNDICSNINKRVSKYLIAHELGHALGLPHSTGTTSVMSYQYNWWDLKGMPSLEDVANVNYLFSLGEVHAWTPQQRQQAAGAQKQQNSLRSRVR